MWKNLGLIVALCILAGFLLPFLPEDMFFDGAFTEPELFENAQLEDGGWRPCPKLPVDMTMHNGRCSYQPPPP